MPNPCVEVLVDGVNVSGITKQPSISIQNQGTRSSAKVVFWDLAGTWLPPRNAEIQIRINNPEAEDFLGDEMLGDEGVGDGAWVHEILFGGFLRAWTIRLLGQWVDRIESTGSFLGDDVLGDEEVGDPSANSYYPREITVPCFDWSALLDQRFIDTTYTSQTCKQIIDHVNANALDGLGFSTANVDTGPTIAKLDASGKVSAREVLKRVQDQSGGRVYWIDHLKQIYLKLPSSTPAPIRLTDTSTDFETISPEYSDELYRNVQHVRKEDGTVVTRTNSAEVALYGRVENLVAPKGVTTTAGAEAHGDGLLDRYGHTLASATIVTRTHRVKPGQTCKTVSMSSLGLYREMVVDSVDTLIEWDHILNDFRIPWVKYTVKVSEFGDQPGDYIEYFRERFKG